jgi:large subunit ribosomal protein L9
MGVKMKVILLKDVQKLGKEGEIVQVKDGYARNFLIPKEIALKAVKGSYKRLEELKKVKSKVAAKKKNSFLELKDKLEAISLTITAEVKDKDEIYGSVSEAQILKLLDEEGIKLEKGVIVLEEQIRKLGVYNLKVNLHSEVEANLRVWIVKK